MTRAPTHAADAALRQAEIDTAVVQLHLTIDRLEALLSSQGHRAELSALRQLALRLGMPDAKPAPPDRSTHSGIRQFEPARFQRLLELAGPENGAELLARLSEDLTTARHRASTAAQVQDWPNLRGASHVLISLAGSVGAVSLQFLAERINLAAHGQDKSDIGALLPEALGELDALIGVVAATRPVAERDQ